MDQQKSKNLQNVVLKVLEEGENVLDEELKKIDEIYNDENELNRIRKERLENIKKDYELRKTYYQCGHGEYDMVCDERDFFDAIKKSENVVCHFFRSSTTRCEIFDRHLQILAKRHIETRFIKINVEKAPFICANLDIRILPTLVLIQNLKVVHKMIGFEELGSRDNFTTTQLESLLETRGLIKNSQT